MKTLLACIASAAVTVAVCASAGLARPDRSHGNLYHLSTGDSAVFDNLDIACASTRATNRAIPELVCNRRSTQLSPSNNPSIATVWSGTYLAVFKGRATELFSHRRDP